MRAWIEKNRSFLLLGEISAPMLRAEIHPSDKARERIRARTAAAATSTFHPRLMPDDPAVDEFSRCSYQGLLRMPDAVRAN